jgi:hypothetical protein
MASYNIIIDIGCCYSCKLIIPVNAPEPLLVPLRMLLPVMVRFSTSITIGDTEKQQHELLSVAF